MLKQSFQLVIGSIISIPGELMFIILSLSVLFSIIIKKVSSGQRGLALSNHFTTGALKLLSVWWSVQVVKENLKYKLENRR